MASNEFLTWSGWLGYADRGEGTVVNPVISVGKVSAIGVREEDKYGIVNVGLIDTEELWTTGNTAGRKIVKTIGAETHIVEIWAYRQGDYGIVDIGFKTSNGVEVRMTGNPDGVPSERFRINGLRGVLGWEQNRYGITDLRFGGLV